MNSWNANPVTVFAVVAVLAGGGALAYCSVSDNCALGWLGTAESSAAVESEQIEIPQTQASEGETAMLSSRSDTRSHGTVEHADASDFARKVLEADVPVLVDFYADWCGPCQRIAPVLEEIARENPGAKVVKVNVDRSPELAMQYGVQSIPSLKVFEDGRVTAHHVGLASKRQLAALIAR